MPKPRIDERNRRIHAALTLALRPNMPAWATPKMRAVVDAEVARPLHGENKPLDRTTMFGDGREPGRLY